MTDSFKFKENVTGQTDNNGTNNVEAVVPLKYLCNFWQTLKMLSAICETDLMLAWSGKCVTLLNAAAD